jgi:hypothetical protein
MYGRNGKCLTAFLLEPLKGRDNLGDLYVNGRIIFR